MGFCSQSFGDLDCLLNCDCTGMSVIQEAFSDGKRLSCGLLHVAKNLSELVTKKCLLSGQAEVLAELENMPYSS